MEYTKRAELHCHTTSNDLFGVPFMYESVMSPQDLLNQAIKQNIRIIAITDHDYMDGFRQAQHIIEKNNMPLLLIPATEVSTLEGHVLAYGVQKEVPAQIPLKDALADIHKQKGIGIAAHPYMGEFGMHDAVFNHDIDGIEGFNAMTFKSEENDRAKAAATKLDIPCITGSDAHQPGALGKGSVWFKESVKTTEDFIEAIRGRDFRTTESHPNLVRLTWDHGWGHVQIYTRKLLSG